jgi:hypothetical protein
VSWNASNRGNHDATNRTGEWLPLYCARSINTPASAAAIEAMSKPAFVLPMTHHVFRPSDHPASVVASVPSWIRNREAGLRDINLR